MAADPSVAALWWAVIALGAYHGLNPGMGWPLSVSAALMERRSSALLSSLAVLGLGHFAAMTLVLLPFTVIMSLVDWQRELQLAAGGLVIAAGLYLLVQRRHPRMLARIKPQRLALWSFVVALAHGAGFMLLPIYLGLCRIDNLDLGHQAASKLMATNALSALIVASVHTLAMVITGGIAAFSIYAFVGLKFLSRGWFNLDALWAASLVLVGTVAIATAA